VSAPAIIDGDKAVALITMLTRIVWMVLLLQQTCGLGESNWSEAEWKSVPLVPNGGAELINISPDYPNHKRKHEMSHSITI
jgi:hypothetical protein